MRRSRLGRWRMASRTAWAPFLWGFLGLWCAFLSAGPLSRAQFVKSETPPPGANIQTIGCAIQTNKDAYAVGEPIQFTYVCSSPGREEYLIPGAVVAYPLSFGDGIVLEGTSGRQYRLIRLSAFHAMMGRKDLAFTNGSTVATCQFDGAGVRAIQRADWIDTWDDNTGLTPEEREQRFLKGEQHLPAGHYQAWLELERSWKTFKQLDQVQMLRMTREAYQQWVADPKNAQWWVLQGKPLRVHFEVRAAQPDNPSSEKQGEPTGAP